MRGEWLHPAPSSVLRSVLDFKAEHGGRFTPDEAALDVALDADGRRRRSLRERAARWGWTKHGVAEALPRLEARGAAWARFDPTGLGQGPDSAGQTPDNTAPNQARNADSRTAPDRPRTAPDSVDYSDPRARKDQEQEYYPPPPPRGRACEDEPGEAGGPRTEGVEGRDEPRRGRTGAWTEHALADVVATGGLVGVGPLEAEKFFLYHAGPDAETCRVWNGLHRALKRWALDFHRYGNADAEGARNGHGERGPGPRGAGPHPRPNDIDPREAYDRIRRAAALAVPAEPGVDRAGDG